MDEDKRELIDSENEELLDFSHITHRKQRLFLTAYLKEGTITHAAIAAGVSRNSHINWVNNPEYATAFAEAEAAVTERMERELLRRGVEGFEEPVFFQGQEVGRVRKYSDNLLMFALKARAPEKYREKAMLDVNISNNQQEDAVSLNDLRNALLGISNNKEVIDAEVIGRSEKEEGKE